MSRNHPEIFKILIDEVPNINTPEENKYGYTVLHKAVIYGNSFYFDRILGKNPDLTIRESTYSRTALHEAILLGRTDMAKKLIDKKADLSIEDKLGFTAIDYAIRQGNNEIIDYSKGKISQNNYEPIAAKISVNKPGEAMIWRLQNFGWAVKTQNYFFIFNSFYHLTGKEIEPDFKKPV